MGKKKLRPTPSCTDEVDDLRKAISADLDDVYAKVKKEKTSFITPVREYIAAHSEPAKLQARVQKVLTQVGATYDFDAWQDDPDHGKSVTAIMQWSFEHKSMWRGTPKNKVVYKLAKSMAIVGFRQDSLRNQWWWWWWW